MSNDFSQFRHDDKNIDIKETLQRIGFSEETIESRIPLIFNSISLFSTDQVWKREPFDHKNSRERTVAFYNDICYIDEYGNCFESKEEFQRSLDFRSSNTQFDNNDVIIQMLLNSLKRHTKEKAFSAFCDDCAPSQILKVLLNIKSYFSFFRLLDEKLTIKDIYATFAVIRDEFHIMFSNLDYIVLSLKEQDYEGQLKQINLTKPKVGIPYEECLLHVNFQNLMNNDEFKILQYEITNKKFRFKNNDYSYVAAKKALKAEEIAESYYNLLQLTDDKNNLSEKETNRFNGCFTAAYHFQAHYDNIAGILHYVYRDPLPFKCPFTTSALLSECVKTYLKSLADDIFDSGTFNYVKDENSTGTKVRQNYSFLRYGDQVKGMKFKELKFPNKPKDEETGDVHTDEAELKGTCVSSISEKD